MIEGKTKVLVDNKDGTVEMLFKDVLTAGDGAKKEKVYVAKHKATQTANVFKLLGSKNIPTAFIRRDSESSISCHRCKMLPIEFVARRYAFGSYLKRHVHMQSGYRFGRPLYELFHKHSVVTSPAGDPYMIPESEANKLSDDKLLIYTDPFMITGGNQWYLYPNKKRFTKENHLIDIDPLLGMDDLIECIDGLLIPCFEAIEEAWKGVETKHGPVHLVDMKIEIGRTDGGRLVIADTITNDEWRIWPGGDPKNQLDKQCFRDGDILSDIEEKYEMVARLTDQFGV